MTNITARAAYESAINPSSPDGRRITGDELKTITDAFNQRTGFSVMGWRPVDTTRSTQTEFLRSIAHDNPALAEALIGGRDWNWYLTQRIDQDVHPDHKRAATERVMRQVGGDAGPRQPNIPPDLRQQVVELGQRAREAAKEVLAETDKGFPAYFGQLLEGEWRSPKGREILAALGKVEGVTDARDTASRIIGGSANR